MPANDHQVGGDHYASDYQHWDWVADINLPYHPATAAKYVDRWPNKNSDDLKKADHYLQKTIELRIKIMLTHSNMMECFWRLVIARQYSIEKAIVLYYIQAGKWELAREALGRLAERSAERLTSE